MMGDWKGLWDELRRTIETWIGDADDDERSSDPTLLMHLLFTAPVVIALLALARRTV